MQQIPTFMEWVGRRIHELLRGPRPGGDRDVLALAPVLASPATRRAAPLDGRLYATGGYGSPYGYAPPPPKPSGGSSAVTVAIIIAVVVLVLAVVAVLLCAGVGFFAVRSHQVQAHRVVEQAMAAPEFQSPPGFPPPMDATIPVAPELGQSPPGPSAPFNPSAPPVPTIPGIPSSPGAKEARPPATNDPGEVVKDDATLSAGDKLLAEWAGQWHSVRVMEVLDNGQVKIHWEGWGDHWDEPLPRNRLRMPKQ